MPWILGFMTDLRPQNDRTGKGKYILLSSWLILWLSYGLTVNANA